MPILSVILFLIVLAAIAWMLVKAGNFDIKLFSSLQWVGLYWLVSPIIAILLMFLGTLLNKPISIHLLIAFVVSLLLAMLAHFIVAFPLKDGTWGGLSGSDNNLQD